MEKKNKTKKKTKQLSHFLNHHQDDGHHDFLVDSLVQETSEKNPSIGARPAVFQKWEDHWIKVRTKEAKWGDCPRTSLYISTTKEYQKNLLIRLTDLFQQIKEQIDIITGKLNAVRFPHFEKQPKIHVARFQHADSLRAPD